MKARTAKKYYTSFNANAAKRRVAINNASLKREKPLKKEWKQVADLSFMQGDVTGAALLLLSVMSARRRRR